MRRTKIGLFLVMCVAVLSMLTACGGGSMSNVDPAQAEKAVLSTVNKALGTEFANEESLRNKANVVWEKGRSNWKNQFELYDVCPGRRRER